MGQARAKQVPNALSRQRIARQVAVRLAALQEAKVELELIQISEDHETTDPVPGLPPKQEDGSIVYEDGKPVFPSYGERFAEFDAAIARVLAEAETRGVLKLVEAMIEAEQEAEVPE